MNETLKSKKLSTGKTIKISQDQPESPRDWDNMTKMVCFHSKYSIGDDNHDYNKDDYNSWQELEDAIKSTEDPVVILPIYMYDHSGQTISTKPFSSRFDSGQVGYIYITHNMLDAAGLTVKYEETWDDFLARLTACLESDVKIYDQYIRGEVYAFLIEDENGLQLDSCGGFYGDSLEESGMKEYLTDYLSPAEIVEFESESSFV